MTVTRQTLDKFPIGSIVPHSENPRKRPRQQVRKIARSMEKIGFTSPIIVDENNVILAGHGRLLAAQALKLETVPVVRLSV